MTDVFGGFLIGHYCLTQQYFRVGWVNLKCGFGQTLKWQKLDVIELMSGKGSYK